MNRNDIIVRLKQLNMDPSEYWLITGGAMVLYGLREVTHDIDLGCTTKLADELATRGYSVTLQDDGTRKILIGEDVEIFENWLYDRVIALDGIPVISLDGLIAMKKALGREKDLTDIRLIEEYLSKEGEAYGNEP